MLQLAKDEKLIRTYSYTKKSKTGGRKTLYVTNYRIVDEAADKDEIQRREVPIEHVSSVNSYYKGGESQAKESQYRFLRLSTRSRLVICDVLLWLAAASLYTVGAIIQIPSIFISFLCLGSIAVVLAILAIVILARMKSNVKARLVLEIQSGNPEYPSLSIVAGEKDRMHNIFATVDMAVANQIIDEIGGILIDIRNHRYDDCDVDSEEGPSMLDRINSYEETLE